MKLRAGVWLMITRRWWAAAHEGTSQARKMAVSPPDACSTGMPTSKRGA